MQKHKVTSKIERALKWNLLAALVIVLATPDKLLEVASAYLSISIGSFLMASALQSAESRLIENEIGGRITGKWAIVAAALIALVGLVFLAGGIYGVVDFIAKSSA